MGEIRAGQILLFYLFDVAETIDLSLIPGLVGGPAVAARLTPKPVTPPYVQYDKPPLSFEGEAVSIAQLDGFRVRVRVYDYGVISLALSQPFAGRWNELVTLSQSLIENAEIELRAEQACRVIVGRLIPALHGLYDTFLSEDYLVYTIHELEHPMSADQLVRVRGEEIATMLRGERQPLSEQEKTAIFSHRISYLVDDLVIATWNAAIVYDTPSGAQAALEILEFANSQLLEFRYYDQLLDSQLSSLYARLQHPRWFESWLGWRYSRAARQVHSLFIDVNELTDRTQNALKFIGDIYAARLFRLVADRLGLERWKANVEEKLKTLDDIYRFAVEQSAMSRGEFLELTMVILVVLELVLIALGVTR
jgi:hypothetical protein